MEELWFNCVWSVIHIQDENDVDAGKEEEDIDMDMADLETLNYDDLDSVSKLQKTQRYADIMQVSQCAPFLALWI